MRFVELFESKNTYISMFSPIIDVLEDKEAIDDIQSMIQNTIDQYKRKDRIIWFLRYFRAQTLNSLHIDNLLNDDDFNRLYSKYKMNDSATFSSMITDQFWEHFEIQSSKIPELNFDWGNIPVMDLKDKIDQIEEHWADKNKNIIPISDRDELVIKLPSGWGWWNLHKNQCDDEGKAMGHCGNAAGRYGETILSLRKQVSQYSVQPYATFILGDNGFIGEMKGRLNNKPDSSLHPMIIALLKNKMIKGIAGGGYKPENNFSLNDLGEEELEEVFSANPQIKPVYMMSWEELSNPDNLTNIEQQIKILWNNYDFVKFKKMDSEKKRIILERYDSIPEYFMDYNSPSKHVFETLTEENKMSRYLRSNIANLTGWNDQKISIAFHNILQDHIEDFKDIIEREINFVHDGTSLSVTNKGEIEISIDYTDAIDLFDPDSERFAGYGRNSEQPDIADVSDWNILSEVNIDVDDFFETLYNCLTNHSPIDELIQKIIRKYSNATNVGSMVSKDYRQKDLF